MTKKLQQKSPRKSGPIYGWGQVWPHGYYLNNLRRAQHQNTTHKYLSLSPCAFRVEDFIQVFII